MVGRQGKLVSSQVGLQAGKLPSRPASRYESKLTGKEKGRLERRQGSWNIHRMVDWLTGRQANGQQMGR